MVESTSNNNLYLLSSVSGGRTINEQPNFFYFLLAVDLDILGAYGSMLEKLVIPFGKPHLYSLAANTVPTVTLKDFMLSNGNEILPHGLFKIVVSGKLPFKQDLIYSRLFPNQKHANLVSNYDHTDPDSYDSSSPLVMLQKEIINGVITKSILDLIDKVSTPQEKKAFYDLKVESAVYWKESERVATVKDLASVLMKDKGVYEFSFKHETNLDTRSHAWVALPLQPSVSKLRSLRAKYKGIKTPQANAYQNTLKLFVNTMYGVICSRYFNLNNVVLGDIITSAIRVGCWCMSKCQCSTDTCAFLGFCPERLKLTPVCPASKYLLTFLLVENTNFFLQ